MKLSMLLLERIFAGFSLYLQYSEIPAGIAGFK